MGSGASWLCSFPQLLCALTMVGWSSSVGLHRAAHGCWRCTPHRDSTGPADEDPRHRADLGPGSGTPDPKPVQAGLPTPLVQAWGSAICTCLSRDTGWPSHPAEVSESREYKCMSSVMVTVLACGRGQWLPGVVVMPGMCYIPHLLFIGPALRGSRAVIGRWHRWQEG